jgi:hypothetical protein
MFELIRLLILLLETLFAIGCVGSILVLILAGVEDVETVLSKDEPAQKAAAKVEG